MNGSVDYLTRLAGMVVLLACSGLFSASETALFSLRPGSWKVVRERGLPGRSAWRLRRRPRDLLVSLLLANLIVNLAFFAMAAGIGIALQADGRGGAAVLAGAISVAGLVLFGEVIPKTVATRRPQTVAMVGAIPVELFMRLIRPLIVLLSLVVGLITSVVIKLVRPPTLRGARLLQSLLDLSMHRGDLLDEERIWLRELLDFNSLRARDVMVPRVDMACIDLTASRVEAVEVVKRTKYSRLPAHAGSLDQVIGYIEGRELFAWPARALADLVRPIFVTPDTTPVERLLESMRREGHTMALVVDEYGGCAGLLTLEDIVHEIIGELGDEHAMPASRIQVLAPGMLRVSGSLRVRDWNELGGVRFPTDVASTVGGLVTARLDRPAAPGDRLEIEGVPIVVRTVRGGRVVWIDARVAPDATAGAPR